MTSAFTVFVLVLVAGLAWGLNAPVSKLLYAAGAGQLFDGVSLAVVRGFWSIPVFAVAAILCRPRGRAIPRLDILRFIWLGVLFGPGLTGFWAVAAQWTSAAHVALISGLTPPATALLESIVRRRPLSVMRWMAIGLGVAGVAVLALTRSASGSSLRGDALMLAWVVDYACFALSTRALAGRYPSAFISVMSTGIGAVTVAVVGVAIGAGRAIPHPFASPGVALGFFGEMVIGLGLVGPIANVAAIRRSNATIATTGALYASVILGLFAAVILVHERLGVGAILAGVLLCASLVTTFVPAQTAAGEGADESEAVNVRA